MCSCRNISTCLVEKVQLLKHLLLQDKIFFYLWVEGCFSCFSYGNFLLKQSLVWIVIMSQAKTMRTPLTLDTSYVCRFAPSREWSWPARPPTPSSRWWWRSTPSPRRSKWDSIGYTNPFIPIWLIFSVLTYTWLFKLCNLILQFRLVQCTKHYMILVVNN